MLSFYLAGFKRILGIIKKIFLVVAVYFIIINLFIYFINKDKPKTTFDPVKKNREEIYKIINDQKLNKTKEGKLQIALYRIAICGLIGEACTNHPQDADKNFDKSVFGFMSNLITTPFVNPPASGVWWAYNGLINAGFIPKTYAAEGIGFASIKPFASLWRVFRDVSYMLLVLVLITIGFMIMFRMKLNPQTVISIESALPKIVISLLLITFSFPIAGFLIDLMYVLIILGISIVGASQPGFPINEVQNKFLVAGFGDIWDSMFINNNWYSKIPILGGLSTLYNFGNSLYSIMPSIIHDSVQLLAQMILGVFFIRLILNNIGFGNIADMLADWDILTMSWGKLASTPLNITISFFVSFLILGILVVYGPGLLLGLLVTVTLLLLVFRIFFLLLTTYLKIVLMIIFSPLFMLFEAIPGRSAFSFWFKNLLAEVLVFPIVIIILVIGRILITMTTTAGSNIWQPPLLYGIDAKNFSLLIGLGLILMIPDLVKIVKELLGAKGLPVGLTLGTFFGGVGALWGGAQGALGGYTSLLMFPGIGQAIMNSPVYKNLKDRGILPPTQAQIEGEIIAQKIKEALQSKP